MRMLHPRLPFAMHWIEFRRTLPTLFILYLLRFLLFYLLPVCVKYDWVPHGGEIPHKTVRIIKDRWITEQRKLLFNKKKEGKMSTNLRACQALTQHELENCVTCRWAAARDEMVMAYVMGKTMKTRLITVRHYTSAFATSNTSVWQKQKTLEWKRTAFPKKYTLFLDKLILQIRKRL